jgi:hypothetical protein
MVPTTRNFQLGDDEEAVRDHEEGSRGLRFDAARDAVLFSSARASR